MMQQLIEVLGERFMFWYGFVCIALLGLCVGSFLNVVIFRLIKKESIYKEGSHCMKCGAKIRWYDNIPVISYIELKGKCRKCKEQISIQYPVVEALNAVLWVLLFCKFSYSIDTIIYCLMTSICIAIAVIDYRTFEIEPKLQIMLLILGIITLILTPDKRLHLVGAVCLSIFFLIIYLVTGGNGIGFGDVKLIALLGLIVGGKAIYVGFVICALIACVVEIRRKHKTGESKFAFGPYLCMSAYVGVFVGEALLNWYIGLFAL